MLSEEERVHIVVYDIFCEAIQGKDNVTNKVCEVDVAIKN